MFSKVSILTKFFLFAAALFIALTIILSIGAGIIIRQSFLDRIRISVSTSITDASQNLSPGDFSFANASQSAKLFAALYQKVKTPEIMRIKVWDTTGRIIYSDYPSIIGQTYATNKEFLEAIKGEVVADIEVPDKSENISEKDYQQVLEVYTPIMANSQVVPMGIIEIYSSLNEINSRVREARMILFVSIGWVILLTFVLLYFLFKRLIYRPIVDLHETTEAIEKGDRSRRVRIWSDDELGQLAVSFNKMADRVENYSSDLEEKVKERTIELTKSEDELRRVIESSPFGIVISSGSEDRVELVNKKMTELFGYTIADVPDGDHWWKLAYPDVSYRTEIQTSWYQKVQKAMETDTEVEAMEARVVCKDGSVKDVEFRLAATSDKKITVFIDLTEKKKIEAKARSIDELKNTFIKTVSHQLRTPMSAVRWNLETLLGGEVGKLSDPQETFLRMTYEASSKIISTIEDLLLAMDIEEKSVRFEKEKTPIDSLVKSVMEEEKHIAEIKKITLSAEISPETADPIEIDRLRIRKAIQKLIDNALIYTKENGSVTVKLMKKDDRIYFEVADTGVGIPSIEQSRIFEKFHRAANAYTMRPDSSGLGLFIAKYFIESHGGTIGFTSEEGKGSTFWFNLPIRNGQTTGT